MSFSPDYSMLWEQLSLHDDLKDWVAHLKSAQGDWFDPKERGDLPKWIHALEQVEAQGKENWGVKEKQLFFASEAQLDKELLLEFHPWRKGPFSLGDQFIDTEWRSDWKWERVEQAGLDFVGKNVLDIGCGNGYYLWRMLEKGVNLALGVDPYLPYLMQFFLMQKLAAKHDNPWILPIGVEALPEKTEAFDLVFSMGVLYHRRSPMDHLMHLRDLTPKGGQVVLETIVLDQAGQGCLVPQGRYAKMKNVWFLPTVDSLVTWMKKCRFNKVEVIDVAKTSLDEQRRTDWMHFESLSDYLDPTDENKTIEGHPAPSRVVIVAS